MGILTTLKNSIVNNMPDFISRLVNESFMKAFAGSCALVIRADGEISESEKAKLNAYIRSLQNPKGELEGFDSETVIEYFEKYAYAIKCDKQLGQNQVYNALDEIKEDAEQSRLLIRICCELGKADGDFDIAEKKVVISICQKLGLSPSEFGL